MSSLRRVATIETGALESIVATRRAIVFVSICGLKPHGYRQLSLRDKDFEDENENEDEDDVRNLRFNPSHHQPADEKKNREDRENPEGVPLSLACLVLLTEDGPVIRIGFALLNPHDYFNQPYQHVAHIQTGESAGAVPESLTTDGHGWTRIKTERLFQNER